MRTTSDMDVILGDGCNNAPSIGPMTASEGQAGHALEDALASVLAPVLGGQVRVSGLRRLPGGASRETWSFDVDVTTVDGGTVTRALILRRDPVGVPSQGLTLEAALLAAAGKAGVPVAPLVTAGAAGGPLASAFLVVGHVEGETIPRRILRKVAEDGSGDALARQCGRILAALHAVPPAAVPGLPGGDPLEQLRGVLDHLGEPHPVLELGLRQLATIRPPGVGEVVVHGDFRNGNLIVGDDGIRAVLDWELAHRGDPLEDLGWLCARAWRFGSVLPVGGFGNLAALVGAYEEASGTTVDVGALRWWEAVAALRWGVICMMQAHTHLSGAARSVELAAIGRRTCEAEWDLLELLQGDRGRHVRPTHAAAAKEGPNEQPAAAPEMPHDRPTSLELLQAVEEFLRTDVLSASEGRLALHVRVAANVVGMVGRELELGPGQAERHQKRLKALGVRSDGELATAVREGSFDDRFDELGACLRDAVADKLAVANPGYASADAGT